MALGQRRGIVAGGPSDRSSAGGPGSAVSETEIGGRQGLDPHPLGPPGWPQAGDRLGQVGPGVDESDIDPG